MQYSNQLAQYSHQLEYMMSMLLVTVWSSVGTENDNVDPSDGAHPAQRSVLLL